MTHTPEIRERPIDEPELPDPDERRRLELQRADEEYDLRKVGRMDFDAFARTLAAHCVAVYMGRYGWQLGTGTPRDWTPQVLEAISRGHAKLEITPASGIPYISQTAKGYEYAKGL